jgi:Rps23 Pro-64 3,4-dihydroxylase Tpa1-like proline 4-hydroxylase
MESLLKEELLSNGYTSFHLKDLDEEIYNNFKNIFPIGNLKPEMFGNLKHAIPIDLGYQYDNQSLMKKSFEELDIIKKDIVNKYESDCNQVWFYDWIFSVNTENNPLDKIVRPVFNKFYDSELEVANSQVTLYNDSCYLKNHRDGNGEYSGFRRCAILFYLSTDYEKGKGGELVLSSHNETELIVEPTYGNVAILDFTKHDVWHRVEKVIGYNRYCFISFC